MDGSGGSEVEEENSGFRESPNGDEISVRAVRTGRLSIIKMSGIVGNSCPIPSPDSPDSLYLPSQVQRGCRGVRGSEIWRVEVVDGVSGEVR